MTSSRFMMHFLGNQTPFVIRVSHFSLASKMNSITMFISISLFLFLFLSFPPFLTSFNLYSSCSKNFSCGHVVPNAGFPFWGGDRPQSCGHPALKLTCENDLFPMIEIDSVKYLVLNLNESTQTLRISRTDFLNGICSTGSANSTFDSNLFDLVPAYDKYLLMYKCESLTQAAIRQGNFTCDEEGEGYYALFGAELENINCDRSLIVYFSLSSSTDVGNIARIEADIKKGFQLKWKVNDENCRNCTGVCGYYSILNGAICYPPPVTGAAPASPPEKNNQLPLKIGMGAGGAAILCLFLGCVFYVAKRRKEHKMREKHVSFPHFSNGISNPNTILSQSIPSFPYSKSDLENGSTNYGVQVFNYMELEEATKNFDPSRELGEGGFGTVYYGKLSDGREVAVKRLYESNLRRAEQFKNELEILTGLHHPNLVKLYGSTSRRSQELLLVYEYIPNGTVADHLHGKQAYSKTLNWHLRLRIALETADALAYLHHGDIIHRDVKTNNILLDDNFQVKVADFGLSRLFPNNVTHVSTAPQGTPGYVDPEYYQVYQLTDKSDVFSFGVVLIELISSLEAVDMSRHRHDINLSNMALNKIQRGALHELVDPNLGFETDLHVRRMIISVSELAFRCLQQDKEMRPPMDEVLEILRGIENKESGIQQAEVVDIPGDDIRLLKNMPPPLSPDSLTTNNLASTTTTDGSF